MITEVEYLGGGPVTFESFCEKHGLKVVVKERPIGGDGPRHRFYADLRSPEDGCTEVKDGVMLISVHGNGPTVVDAIKDLAPRLLSKRLVVNAYSRNRREIQVPNEWKT